MTSSRQYILDRVRAAKKDMLATTDPVGAAERLQRHAVNLVPERGNLDKIARLNLFKEEAEKVNASVVQLGSADKVPREVARFLKESNIPPKIKMAPRLKDLPWSSTLLETDSGIADRDDAVSVTSAFAGVAETGTLVTISGADTPTTLNFLPLTNIAIVEAGKIYGDYEQAFAKLRQINPEKQAPIDYMPRTLNFITGPSRSADIEQTLLLGAHGPQRLHIIIVDDELP